VERDAVSFQCSLALSLSFSTAPLFYCSTALILPAAKLEAGGIEPPSRNNADGGLYMLSRCFDLDAGGGHRQSPPASSRLFLVRSPTTERSDQPADFGRRVAGIAPGRGRLIN
jgi:hypothetical protein